jgi:hypothetical protein
MASRKYADRAVEFALQEHSALRTEIITLINDARSTERNVIGAIGIVWGFLALHPVAHGDRWAWWVPTFFVVLGWLRILALDQNFRFLHTYLKRTESLFAETDGVQGWETFLRSTHQSVFASGMLIFAISFLATVAVAWYKSRG